MSEYVNGIKISITDMVRIEFVDNTQNEIKLIHTIAMNFDTFKNLRDAAINIIEQHEANLKAVAKAN